MSSLCAISIFSAASAKLDRAHDRRFEQHGLVFVMSVQGALARAGGHRDQIDRRPFVSPIEKHLERAIEQ
jgi:hypothetical protein